MASDYTIWVAAIQANEDAVARALRSRNHHAQARRGSTWLEWRVRRGEIRDVDEARQALADMDEAQAIIEEHLTLLRTQRAQLSASRPKYE